MPRARGIHGGKALHPWRHIRNQLPRPAAPEEWRASVSSRQHFVEARVCFGVNVQVGLGERRELGRNRNVNGSIW